MQTETTANRDSPAARQHPLTLQRPLTVVTVAYNSADVLAGLLDSLPAALAGVEHWQVVVVDNASADGSPELAEAHPLRPRVVRTGRNGGYAAGINAGLADISPAADVLILNPDVRLVAGAVRPLTERLDDPAVGIAVPRTLRENGKMLKSLRREPSLLTAWAEAILGGRLTAALDLGEIVTHPAPYAQDGLADWASGGVMAVAARARAAVGAWDESFFLYSEEVEFQRRVRMSGLRIGFVAKSVVVHKGGDYRRDPRLYALLTANRVRYYRRYHGPVATALFRLGVVSGEALRSPRGSPIHRAGLHAALRYRAGTAAAL
jgi:GT2 family glycosyltransferase